MLTVRSPAGTQAASERAGVTTSLPRARIEVKGKENFIKKKKQKNNLTSLLYN